MSGGSWSGIAPVPTPLIAADHRLIRAAAACSPSTPSTPDGRGGRSIRRFAEL